ncbi:Nramp family divalent metal transporter [Sphingobacterium yanglingense]|uniref:Mn2+/Fe2+ NRAMP family transporter n=1 Tax=Sphingobacterium yanglingense TaxID=1437280 RepID=A0A4R6WH58_9SPHI|nr:Nramp family divalent metal transporter [Sphingobacterium yanglingense]TDQ79503.1 Mn2+/Fe2+ NRAMP family transporter [Sphingobacterium yanglingense]
MKRILNILGPGIITAALVFGPSKMTITSKMGADYAYSLIWIVFVALFFMGVYTAMCSRIGASQEKSLLTLIKTYFNKPIGIAIGIGVFLVATSFQAGNSIGVGIAIGEATGTAPYIWVIVFTILGICLLFFPSFYKVMEKLMIALVLLMLACFVATLFLAEIDIKEFGKGLIPSIPDGSLGLVIAFTASCFSLVGAFYQSYLIQERKKMSTEGISIKKAERGGFVGVGILGFMSLAVMVCAAAVLFPKGIHVGSAAEMGKALEPLFGKHASSLFFVGLFGAAFSSLVGNATVGGALLGDALGFGSSLSSTKVKFLISIVMILGCIVAVSFGKLPLELIVIAQSITIFLVPFIGVSIYAIANSKKVMGDKANNLFYKIVGALGLLVILILMVSNVYDMFLK